MAVGNWPVACSSVNEMTILSGSGEGGIATPAGAEVCTRLSVAKGRHRKDNDATADEARGAEEPVKLMESREVCWL